MGHDHDLVPLRREVREPRRDSGGFGIIAVSAVAMMFAVASAAVVARSRPRARQCPAAYHQVQQREPRVARPTPPPPQRKPAGISEPRRQGCTPARVRAPRAQQAQPPVEAGDPLPRAVRSPAYNDGIAGGVEVRDVVLVEQ